MSAVSVAALISSGRHSVSGAPRACRGDAVALAVGMSLVGDNLRVVHAGDAQEPSLRDYLAYGATKIEVLPAAPDVDVVSLLTNALADVDVILTGSRTELGEGSGLLPYLLAQALGRTVVANALEIRLGDGEAQIRQFLPKGQRRLVACSLPAVIAVHPLAPVRLGYAYSRRISGSIETGTEVGPPSVAIERAWTVEVEARHPIRLKAQEKKAGHARMRSAIVSEAKGGVVAFEGTTVDKAQVVLNYLREHRLVDF
ncbi:MAG: hypothetical protein QM780_04550 [Hyphomicrobium sp.]|uniref:hypothetical protein n=1 Tax=Hyphomicrobium sp. TaxID=82 RepID=UPI0039E3092E